VARYPVTSCKNNNSNDDYGNNNVNNNKKFILRGQLNMGL
jgi:predicted RNA-binding protein